MTKRPVSEARMSDDLRELTRELAEAGWDPSGGFLGGEYGYGADYENDVFEMHPFWWGDCECGHEARECEWEDSNPHASGCYQAALKAELGDMPYGDERVAAVAALCGRYGLDPHFGSMVHCTCDHRANWDAWHRANTHDPKCGVARPNFLHKPSGTRVDWYKYIGRGMEFDPVDRTAWVALMQACMSSVLRNPDYVKPEPVTPMTDAEMAAWADANTYVFEGTLPEVMQQVDETLRPVQVIEALDREF